MRNYFPYWTDFALGGVLFGGIFVQFMNKLNNNWFTKRWLDIEQTDDLKLGLQLTNKNWEAFDLQLIKPIIQYQKLENQYYKNHSEKYFKCLFVVLMIHLMLNFT